MSRWLDAETKAILQGVPPEKLAPPDTIGFMLVLLFKGNDDARLRRALAKAGCANPSLAETILASRCPVHVSNGLTVEDAMLGQFELACCDSAAVFIRDEVVAELFLNSLDDLFYKYGPMFRAGAAVFIGSFIGQSRAKLADQITGGTHQLHTVKSGFLGSYGAFYKGRRRLFHFFGRQCSRCFSRIPGRDGGRSNSLFA